MSWKRIAGEAGMLLVIAVLLGAAFNPLRRESHRLSWTGPGSLTPQAPERPTPQPVDSGALFTGITAEVAYRMHGAGALFLDARRTTAYEAGHIAGARSIPVWEDDADTRVDALRRDGVPLERDIVVYCSGPACEDSARLAEKLALAGFYKLSLYKDGFPDWENRGWPIKLGVEP